MVSLDVSLETPAGRFENCVEVLELGGKLELEVRTIYCPGIGPVSIASTMRSKATERTITALARLRGFSVHPSAAAGR